MSAQRQDEPRFIKAEYWKREREIRDKSEYFAGQIYADVVELAAIKCPLELREVYRRIRFHAS